MATQKPISTISYNSEAFLREKLDTWVASHIIQSYMYVCHKGEDGDKDHIHLRIEPNKKLDPMDLTDTLREFVPGHDKPLGVRPWRPSKEEDWLLYAVHEEAYLKLKYGGGDKGEKLPYSWQDIKASDGFDLEVAYVRALSSLRHSNVNLATRIQNGESPINLIYEGENVFTVNAIYKTLFSTDYQKAVDKIGELQQLLSVSEDRVQQLEDFLASLGFSVEYSNSNKLRCTLLDNAGANPQ